MIEKIRNITKKKSFHLIVMISIIAIIIFVFGIILLKYNVEGEKNMPFELSKITIISSSEGMDKETVDSKWAFDVFQNNDIYLYIDKNNNYNQTEAISSLIINNIELGQVTKGKIDIYKPISEDVKTIFKNSDESKVNNIEYKGDMESDFNQLKISNQGGIVAFRISNNLGEYKSDDEEIIHKDLLKKLEILNENLSTDASFDLRIKLVSGKEYKTNITLKLPIGNVVEEGTTSTEMKDLKEFIFKRENN